MPTRAYRVAHIDFCVADIVAALNAANIRTVASCCGHGKMDGNVLLEDREIVIKHLPKKRLSPTHGRLSLFGWIKSKFYKG